MLLLELLLKSLLLELLLYGLLSLVGEELRLLLLLQLRQVFELLVGELLWIIIRIIVASI